MTRHDLGDGPLCPESPMHGKTYIIPTPDGRELCWCPVDQGRYALVNGHDAGERVSRANPLQRVPVRRTLRA